MPEHKDNKDLPMYRKLALAALSATALSLPMAAAAAPKGCPPGLAKKNVACTPPGQARKSPAPRVDDDRAEWRRFERGERLEGDVILIRDPARYGLGDGTYYRGGDVVYRVDPETRRVLNVMGALAALAD